MPLAPITRHGKIKPFEVYDIETTTDLKKVYLVGWHNGTDFKFWESEPLAPDDPDSAMSQFLRWLFGRGRCKKPLYAHNGGNFDAVFALAGIIKNWPGFKVEIIPSQSSILSMKVSEGKKTWKFLDSARSLPDSLENLGQCFVGSGKVKDVDYEKLHLDPRRYEYLKTDCVLLYDVLTRYFALLHDEIGGQAGISAASTALATFRTSYQKEPLPDISDHAAALCRAGYYGGRCEPLRKEFIAAPDTPVLRDYDVNSLYPSQMRKHQPVDELNLKGVHLDLTGFIDATVKVKKCHIPVLPCRTDDRLLFPWGTWRGVFSTVELRLAEEAGQLASLEYHDAVYFRTRDIFSSYVDSLYKFRDKSDPTWSLATDRLAKILLNTLYGKFGSQPIRETIHIRPDINDVIDKQMQQMPSSVGVDCYIERSERQAAYMLPQISAWVTALGRVTLCRALLRLEREAYYCDTDSVFTPSTLETGTRLGEWKDEFPKNPISYAYFLSPKVYVLKHVDGKVTNKAKGFAKFGEKLPADAVALLSTGKSLEVSRFAKARSVIRGDFGLILSRKRCHLDYEKRIFHSDGSSEPRKVSL